MFDGHGGKQSATFASKNLLQHVTKYLDRCKGPAPQVVAVDGVEQADLQTWATQDALIERLPKV